MPELPEVEYAARALEAWARGRTVKAISCDEPRALAGGKVGALATLIGSRLAAVERIGKNLLLTFAASERRTGVWSHLGMTGKWVRRAPTDPPPRFARVRIAFTAGVVIYFVDMRLFGFFRLVPNADFARQPVLAALGPDPLRQGIDIPRLAARLVRVRAPIKVALLDQKLIPGVGNIQASEGLFRAAIDPRRAASSLNTAELRRLSKALIASFQFTLRSLSRRKDSSAAGAAGAAGAHSDVAYVEEPGTRNPFKVYDRAGERCPRCHRGTITRLVQAGRSTYFCPRCQV